MVPVTTCPLWGSVQTIHSLGPHFMLSVGMGVPAPGLMERVQEEGNAWLVPSPWWRPSWGSPPEPICMYHSGFCVLSHCFCV